MLAIGEFDTVFGDFAPSFGLFLTLSAPGPLLRHFGHQKSHLLSAPGPEQQIGDTVPTGPAGLGLLFPASLGQTTCCCPKNLLTTEPFFVVLGVGAPGHMRTQKTCQT